MYKGLDLVAKEPDKRECSWSGSSDLESPAIKKIREDEAIDLIDMASHKIDANFWWVDGLGF